MYDLTSVLTFTICATCRHHRARSDTRRESSTEAVAARPAGTLRIGSANRGIWCRKACIRESALVLVTYSRSTLAILRACSQRRRKSLAHRTRRSDTCVANVGGALVSGRAGVGCSATEGSSWMRANVVIGVADSRGARTAVQTRSSKGKPSLASLEGGVASGAQSVGALENGGRHCVSPAMEASVCRVVRNDGVAKLIIGGRVDRSANTTGLRSAVPS